MKLNDGTTVLKNRELIKTSKIKKYDDIKFDEIEIVKTHNSVYTVTILSFQLLDSYNKEEREGKEQKKKDAD
jgi:hypothetical protein